MQLRELDTGPNQATKKYKCITEGPPIIWNTWNVRKHIKAMKLFQTYFRNNQKRNTSIEEINWYSFKLEFHYWNTSIRNWLEFGYFFHLRQDIMQVNKKIFLEKDTLMSSKEGGKRGRSSQHRNRTWHKAPLDSHKMVQHRECQCQLQAHVPVKNIHIFKHISNSHSTKQT